MMTKNRKRTFPWIVGTITLIIMVIALVVALKTASAGLASSEAVMRVAMARDLFHHDTTGALNSRGYHMLIDSLATPPLATLATIPFAWMGDETFGAGAGFLALTAILAAIASAYLLILARILSLPWLLGLVAAPAFFFIPWSPLFVAKGSSAIGIIAFGIAAITHLTDWLKNGNLFSLALAAVLVGLGILWDTRLSLLLLAGAGAVAGQSLKPNARMPKSPDENRAYRMEGALVVFLTPACYMPAIWILFNWLIFGDPMRLLRNLTPEFRLGMVSLFALAICFCLALFIVTRCVPKAWSPALLLLAPALAALLLVPPAQMTAECVEPGVQWREAENLSELRNYLDESAGGRMLLVVGRSGYLACPFLDDLEGFKHLPRLDPNEIQLKTEGRDVLLILSRKQVNEWKAGLAEQSIWNENFLEERPLRGNETDFGRWHIYRLIKPERPLVFANIQPNSLAGAI